MIPSVLSSQVRQAVEDFLQTQYRISTSRFARTISDFVARGEAFKGAYVSFQLPFKVGTQGAAYFPGLSLPFAAYVHQEKAFARLKRPDPTIIATGTGSGKTEAFLYPVLDYCRQHAGEPGIKAILIYPMNALAMDQALRIAGIVHGNKDLRGRVTAGLYIGGQDAVPQGRMTAGNIITRRQAMQQKPPDILLTNYSMLDYLLVRPRDARIWKDNRPGALRFIVVDELHTFDGAQETDLTCLLRRLKHRLRAPDACPVGTSATLAPQHTDALQDYAKKIFGEAFDKNAIISEDRLTARDFLGEELIRHVAFPASLEPLAPARHGTLPEYVAAQHDAWFGTEITADEVVSGSWRSRLGQSLRQHVAFHNLIKIVEAATVPWRAVARRLAPEAEAPGLLLESLLALVSYARHPQDPSRPLLNVHIQLWIRELRRMLVSTREDARLVWYDDLEDSEEDRQEINHLPLAVCRNCGAAGWAARQRLNDPVIEASPAAIYRAFFGRSAEFRLLYPDSRIESPQYRLCLKCRILHPLSAQACADCTDHLTVSVPDLINQKDGKSWSRITCASCGAVNTVSIVGAQAASLTSVAIGQLFGSRHNDDKKVLAFSDSVQDASHRAGYFQARTFSFNVRTSLLQHILQDEQNAALDVLAARYVQAARDAYGDIDFVGTFIAPNLCWLADYAYLTQHGELPKGSDLVAYVEKRLEWEVYQAFGLNARLGRSLENTLSATAFARAELMACDPLLERLRNELGGLRNLTARRLHQFLIGLIYRLRVSGGILHEVLGNYIKRMGRQYGVMSDLHIKHMPRMGPRSPRPAFITSGRSDTFMTIGSGQRRTWLGGWARRSLFADDEIPWIQDQLYRYVLGEAARVQVLARKDSTKHPVWGLRPDALQITTSVNSCRCNQCSYQVTVPQHEHALWVGMPCVRHACFGAFEAADTGQLDYYRARYRSADVRRIVAKEHTGLLARKEREQLEKDFMRQDSLPWDPNIISCTPTLELGVDIGDLSSVILCSVPPTQANYVQRIGRAGRRDGNAFGLTVAAAQPHDLYYFAEPEDMIAGDVHVPGTFLRAPAVLKRQLAAFTLDSWIASGVSEKAVPPNLRLMLGHLDKEDEMRFPYSWLAYADENAESLFEQFIGLFGEHIDKQCREQLQCYLNLDNTSSDPTLRFAVLQAFATKRDERTKLTQDIGRVWRQIEQLKSRPKDQNFAQEERELHRHRRMLGSIKATINKMPVFNFLTKEGILPNYAFPQSLVTLQSTILYSEGDTKNVSTDEYTRLGASAIRELAPGNRFYAGGRSVRISQITLKDGDIEDWRFCDSCMYLERVATATQPRCPECESSTWRDTGRKHAMVRMLRVASVSNDRASRSYDDAEVRERTQYHVRTHVQFSRRDASPAYVSRKAIVPFGFEYVRKAALRTVNFGHEHPCIPVVIAGEEKNTRGFACCPKCGMVRMHGDSAIRHAYDCCLRGKGPDAGSELFLYHAFTSEAVRILLPAAADGPVSREADSFCAALNMGLKEYFRGRVSHLRTMIQSAPLADDSRRKVFVFIYDSVPGGTGYLKGLARSPEKILEVLRIAQKRLEQCECAQDATKDGCYRCLYAYRNSWVRDRISREVASATLEKILEQGPDLARIQSLDQVDLNPFLESQCEVKLVEELEQRADGAFERVFRNGKEGYRLTHGDQTWEIECQVSLGPKENLAEWSRPDFVFRPASQCGALPVAVFTDGYAYHCGQLAEDTAKRMAILASGRYHVWSLTWNDLTANDGGTHYEDYIALDAGKEAKIEHFLNHLADACGDLGTMKSVRTAGSMDLFMAFLKEPHRARWTVLAYAHAVLCVQDWTRKDWSEAASGLAPRWFGLDRGEDTLVGQRTDDSDHSATILVRTSRAAVSAYDTSAVSICVHLDDGAPRRKGFKAAWNGFLRLMNLFQFLPQRGFFCTTGMEQDRYDGLEPSTPCPKHDALATGREERCEGEPYALC